MIQKTCPNKCLSLLSARRQPSKLQLSTLWRLCKYPPPPPRNVYLVNININTGLINVSTFHAAIYILHTTSTVAY